MNQKNFVVAKYGGTSMAQPEIVAGIVESNPHQKIVVCSAPGKLPGKPEKITNLLFLLSSLKNTDEQRAEVAKIIIGRFKEIVSDLSPEFRDSFTKQIAEDLKSDDHNFLVSRGEYYSALAFAKRVNASFVDAKDVFCFDKNNKFNRQKSTENIQNNLIKEGMVIVPGFYGSNPEGKICLFGRGGSDRSGAILSASLGWEYQNWTDVDGIMSADPNLVKNTNLIHELTYEEIREGAHGGSSVLMGDSVLDLEYGNCDTVLKNTFNAKSPGTRIKKSRIADQNCPVVGLSARDDLSTLSIYDLGMRDSKGYLAKILEILAEHRISIEHMPAAQDSVTITFHNKHDLVLDKLVNEISKIAVSPSAKCVVGSSGAVYLVGEALRELNNQHTVVVNALKTLEDHNIIVWAIIMHPNSPSVTALINQEQTKQAQQILHAEFIVS